MLERLVRSAYASLARRAMPDSLWRGHGEPMVAVFGEVLADARRRKGWIGVVGTGWREMWSLARTGALERRRARLSLHEPRTRTQRGQPMQQLWRDLRYACRAMLRAPVFAAVVILTLGLGIGANTAIFSVVNGVLLRPLPYESPNELVRGFTKFPSLGFPQFWVSWGQYNILRERNKVFTELAVYGHTSSWNLSGIETPTQIRGARITHTLLPTLGVSPAMGRNFSEAEDVPNNNPVIILGYSVWQRQFGGAVDVVGRSIELNGGSREVVGVLPKGFRLPSEFGNPQAAEVFLPMARAVSLQPGSGSQNFNLVARMRPGVAVDAADAAIRQTMEEIRTESNFPEGFSGMAISLHETVVGDVRLALFVLLATVGFVLLIACANVANLMLARSESRGREIAVRVALGAGRGRLVRQLLTESVLFSILGGGVAVLLAHFGVKALVAIDPGSVPRADTISTDFSVLGFTGILAVLTGVIFGLIPAARAGREAPQQTLKESVRGTTGRGQLGVGRVLATTEVALAFVLAIGAGLLIQSFRNLRTVDSGLEAKNVLTLATLVPSATYPDAEVPGFYEKLEERTRALPGVQRVAIVSELPIGGSNYDWTFRIEGRDVPQGQSGPNADYSVISREYFQTMGIPLLRGRSFTEFDRDSVTPVVVINQTMAEQFWPNEDPIGKRISLFGPPIWHEIVGIVGDVHSRGLAQPPRAEMFLDHRQMSALGSTHRSLSLVIQTSNDPMALVTPIRGVFRELDPNLPFGQVQTVDTIVAGSLSQERFSMLLLGVFAMLALSLSAIGIYGVMSYSVAHRAQEIGIRMALGADRKKVRQLIVRQGMGTAVIGLGIGLVLAVVLTRGMRSLLYQVGATDPLTYVAVGVLLAGVSWASNYLPALRASRGDPMLALRGE